MGEALGSAPREEVHQNCLVAIAASEMNTT